MTGPIEMGSLVECPSGVRMFVVDVTRDDKGIPSYALSWDPDAVREYRRTRRQFYESAKALNSVGEKRIASVMRTKVNQEHMIALALENRFRGRITTQFQEKDLRLVVS